MNLHGLRLLDLRHAPVQQTEILDSAAVHMRDRMCASQVGFGNGPA